ncbi:MAG: argininosuccinate lyase, partial [Exiguobacterium sp.]|nr:argininosuccinate lyase [Exiguobacterium sp.]
MSKLWGGRFEKTASDWVDAFGASIEFDAQLVLEDLEGSMAHVTMLGDQGILLMEEVTQILDGLQQLKQKALTDELKFEVYHEDIHMNLEALLHEAIGPVAGKMHTARSRNDQVATDMHLYLKERVKEVIQLIESLQHELHAHASENVETIMPGYTHLQRAQPITFGHHLMAYASMFLRDRDRLADCKRRTLVSPIGSCALAGTTYATDRAFEAAQLGMEEGCSNSIDGVSDRDFAVELLSALSIIMMHL